MSSCNFFHGYGIESGGGIFKGSSIHALQSRENQKKIFFDDANLTPFSALIRRHNFGDMATPSIIFSSCQVCRPTDDLNSWPPSALITPLTKRHLVCGLANRISQ
jgi:hypothetical protein